MVVCPYHDGQYNILLTDSSVQQASWNRLAQFFKVITNPITIAPQKPIPQAVSANKGADPARGINPEPPTAKAPDISIREAAKAGNIEAVKQHLAAGTDVNVKNDFGFTPLLKAAQFGRREVAELLIAKGADVSVKDKFGRTPLHCAADEGQTEVAELLIAAGADVNGRDNGDRTPLDFAVMKKQNEISDLLRKHGGKTGAEL